MTNNCILIQRFNVSDWFKFIGLLRENSLSVVGDYLYLWLGSEFETIKWCQNDSLLRPRKLN